MNIMSHFNKFFHSSHSNSSWQELPLPCGALKKNDAQPKSFKCDSNGEKFKVILLNHTDFKISFYAGGEMRLNETPVALGYYGLGKKKYVEPHAACRIIAFHMEGHPELLCFKRIFKHSNKCQKFYIDTSEAQTFCASSSKKLYIPQNDQGRNSKITAISKNLRDKDRTLGKVLIIVNALKDENSVFAKQGIPRDILMNIAFQYSQVMEK